MTREEKELIIRLKGEGLGYVRIAKKLGLSENTVKSFLQRNKTSFEDIVFTCKCCGIVVKQNPHRKRKLFCSDHCRMKWWNSRQDQVNRKSQIQIICAHCGKTVRAYEKSGRKYCSHACYVEARFGGRRDG